MSGFLNDVRHGLRLFARDPVHTAAAVFALALGIGAASALFSVVDATLIRKPPFPDPDRLVMVWERNLDRGLPYMYASPPTYEDWVSETRTFSGLAGFVTERRAVAIDGRAVAVQGAEVTANLFGVLGVGLQKGRGLTPSDRLEGAAPVAVIGDGMWRTRFGADAGIIGRRIEVDGTPVEVVGVAEPGMTFPPDIVENRPATGETELWLPWRPGSTATQRGAHYLTVVGRLGDDVALERAADDVRAVADRLARAYPETNEGWTAAIVPLQEQLTGQSRGPLLVLLGAVGLVLLIACVNVANLLLARGTGRSTEIAVRAALGARRSRLVRQLLTESALLGLAGGLLGLLLARAALVSMVSLAPASVLGASGAALDLRAVGFALLASMASALIFGTLPALSASSTALSPHLKEGGRSDTGDRSGFRLQSLLVTGEVALSLTLLVGAGLLFQTLVGLLSVDAGIDPTRRITASVALPEAAYPDGASRVAAYRELGRAIRANPAIGAAGFIYDVPLSQDRQGTSITLRGESEVPEGENRGVGFSIVTSGYFDAMGIPLLAGRDFGPEDRGDGEPVLIVNQALVDRYLADGDPLTERIGIMGRQARVVGVVGDVRHQSLRADPGPVAYMVYDQQSWSGTMSLVALGTGDASATAEAVRREVAARDPSIPLFDLATMEAVVGRSVDRERFSATILAGFAGLALILAAVGIFGVVSHAVARRRRETGIRIALGAGRGDVLSLVVRRSMRPVLGGVALGIPAALVLARVLRGSLYGVAPTNPVTYLAVSAILVFVSLLAAWLPAVRATRVDPAVTLRSE